MAAGPDAEPLAVIKADAYGHGATLCAPALVSAGARWLGVTDVEEGALVRQTLGEITTRIMMMCGMEPADADALVEHGLTPVVWTAEHIHLLDGAAQAAGQRVAVHVEVDTGMARQGAAVGAPLDAVLKLLATSQWVVGEGLMTHLCCAEVAGAQTTAEAKQQFGEAISQVASAGMRPRLLHVANTSAVDEGSTLAWLRQQAADLGARAMVRTGLALYGYCLPLEGDGVGAPHLQSVVEPVMTWKASVLDVREVQAGATVGYGATFVADHTMRLALLQVGYADGFRREASSGVGSGWVMVHGKRAAVVGRVSMNLTVVDVSDIENVAVGTEAVLLGEGVSAEDHAQWAGTIAYEILCGVRGRRIVT